MGKIGIIPSHLKNNIPMTYLFPTPKGIGLDSERHLDICRITSTLPLRPTGSTLSVRSLGCRQDQATIRRTRAYFSGTGIFLPRTKLSNRAVNHSREAVAL